MRVPTAVLAALLALPLTAHADEASGTLRITEILPAPDAALGQREFIELRNAGASSLDLAGWRLRDAPTASNSTNEFVFPSLVLAPGARVVVWSNASGDALGPSWSSSPSKTVWNDAGDAATLLDPTGAVHDWVGYGSTTQSPPPGQSMEKPATPGRGRSLQLDGEAWVAAEPTPGRGLGEQGGAASARVANVAPSVALQAPASARPGEAVVVRLAVSDANGGGDVTGWTLASLGQVAHRGNGSFDGDLVVTAPAHAGSWTLAAAASDRGGANATASAVIAVRHPKVAVQMPPGGLLRFPEILPGDRNVTSLDAFTVRNEGEDPAMPRLDVSSFRAGAATIPVDGNLWVGATLEGATTWLRYEGPLQPLPALAAGASMTLSLRIGAVPVPAAAGTYGTTFTVVA